MLHDCMGRKAVDSLPTQTHKDQMQDMQDMGLICVVTKDGVSCFTISLLGNAHIKQLSSIPLPAKAYINTLTGEEIK